MKVIYTIILALFVIFIITFSLENTLPVRLRYYDYLRTVAPDLHADLHRLSGRGDLHGFHGYRGAVPSDPDDQPPEQDDPGSPP